MTDRRDRARELTARVRRCLLAEWDPIGVRDGGPEDEYDAYAPRIVGLLLRGASVDEVFECLRHIETETMGLEGDAERTRLIARKLVDAQSPLDSQL